MRPKNFWLTPTEINYRYTAPKICVVATDYEQAQVLARSVSRLGDFDNWIFV